MIDFRSPLNLTLAAILVLATLAGLVLIAPDARIPVRWGFDLQPAMTMPKLQGLLQLPLAAAFVWAIYWAIQRFGNSSRQRGQAMALSIVLSVVTGFLALVQLATIVYVLMH